MSEIGEFYHGIDKRIRSQNQSPVQVGQITNKAPLVLTFNGIELSKEYGDTIYLNNLLLDDNIELDVASLDNPQNIDPALWQGDNAPTGTVSISGTQKQFLTDLYNWIKAHHDRYIIHIGDYVAVQKLGNNTYIILEKVQEYEQ